MATVKIYEDETTAFSVGDESGFVVAGMCEVPEELLREYERVLPLWEAVQAQLADIVEAHKEAENAERLKREGWTVEEPTGERDGSGA